MYEDEAGNLWFGMESGLVRYHEGAWRRYTTDDGLPANDIRYIIEAQDGALWLGTTGGLGRYHNDTFSALTTQDGLSSNLIRSIYQDEDGLLWAGTEGRGLNRIDLSGETPSITVYRRQDGLFDEVIHQILEDDFGRFWMSSNRGIFWISREGLNAFATGMASLVYSMSYTERKETHLANEDFNVEQLAAEIGLDRSHLYRRLRALSGQTPTEIIRSMRLERASQLLAGQAGLVSEVAYGVGFKSVSHFSKCFRERYGVTPSIYMADEAEPED